MLLIQILDQKKLSDLQLLNLVTQDNRLAFNELFDRYWKSLLSTAMKVLNDEPAAEDVVQELFIDLWNRRNKLQITNLKGYLHTAIRFQTAKLISRTKFTSNVQRSSLTLPDGTKIRLNIGSSISFPEEFSKKYREVQLTGEAYFEVTKDPNRPFIILSGDIKTTVLGTAFNLRAYQNEDIDVTVTEGMVQVESADRLQTLGVGDQAIYSIANNQLTKNKVDVLNYIGWTNPEFTFDMVPFENVLTDLGRWYHKEVIIDGPSSSACLIRANLENNGLIPILSRLQSIVSFQYEKFEEEKVLIKYNGCIN